MFSLTAMAEVNYQVVPLPQEIRLDASGKTALLVKGQAVSYPADNAQMRRNALFAQEYLGLTPQVEAKKVKMPVMLVLGLQQINRKLGYLYCGRYE